MVPLPRMGSPVQIAVLGAGLVVMLALLARPGGDTWALLAAAAALGFGLWQNVKVFRARRAPLPAAVRRLGSVEEIREVLAAPRALVYKHSTACPLSARALGRVWEFAGTHPDVTVFQVQVLEAGSISDRVAEQLGVPHASPQVIALVAGEVRGEVSHGGIRLEALEDLLAD